MEDGDESRLSSSPSVEKEREVSPVFPPSGRHRGSKRKGEHGCKSSPSLSKSFRRSRRLHLGETEAEVFLRRAELLRVRQEAERQERRKKLMEDLGLLDCWTEVEEPKSTGEECKVPEFTTGRNESQLPVREELKTQQGNTSQAEGASKAERASRRDEDGELVLGYQHRDGAQRKRDPHSTAAERGKKNSSHVQRSDTGNVGSHLFHEEAAAAHSTPAQSGLPSRESTLFIAPAAASSAPFSPVECSSSENTAGSVFDQHQTDTATTTSAPPPATQAVSSSDPQCFSSSAVSPGDSVSAGTSTVSPSCTTRALPSVSSPLPLLDRLLSATGLTSAVTHYGGSPSVTSFSSSVQTPGEGGQSAIALARNNGGVVSTCSSPSPSASPSAGAGDPSVASSVSDVLSLSNNAPVSLFSSSDETSPRPHENAQENTTAPPSVSPRTEATPIPVSLSASPVFHVEGRGQQRADETSVALSLEEGKASNSTGASSRWRERVAGAVWTAASCLLPSGIRWHGRHKQGDGKQGDDGKFLRRGESENKHQQLGPLSPAKLGTGTGSSAYTEEREESYSQGSEAVGLKAACSLESFNVRASPSELCQVQELGHSSLLTAEGSMKKHRDMNFLFQDKAFASKCECAPEVGHEHIEEVGASPSALGFLAGSSRICTSTHPITSASESETGETSTAASTSHLRSCSPGAPHDNTRNALIPLERGSNDVVLSVLSPHSSNGVACFEASLPPSFTERSNELSTPCNNTDAFLDNMTFVTAKKGSALFDKGAGAVDLHRSEASPSSDSRQASEVTRPTNTLCLTDDDSVQPSCTTTKSASLSDTMFGSDDSAASGLKGDFSTTTTTVLRGDFSTTTNSSECETNEFTRNLFFMHTGHPSDEGQKPSEATNVLSNVCREDQPCKSESGVRRPASSSSDKKDSRVSLERRKKRTARGAGRVKETRPDDEAIKAEDALGDQLETVTPDQGEGRDLGETMSRGRPCRKRKERGAAASPSAARTTGKRRPRQSKKKTEEASDFLFADETSEERQRRLEAGEQRRKEAAQILKDLEDLEQLQAQRRNEHEARYAKEEEEEVQVRLYAERLRLQQQREEHKEAAVDQSCWSIIPQSSTASDAGILRVKLQIVEPSSNSGRHGTSPAPRGGSDASFPHTRPDLSGGVRVRRDQTFGALAEGISQRRGLPDCCRQAIVFLVDGDTCSHDCRFGDEELMLEDDIQIDVRLPGQANQPLPHVHGCDQESSTVGALGEPGTSGGVSAVPLSDGTFLILDD
ncbi:hypothetical protein CSUI_000787 [Cystoisospora suis]|uniref:Uncharacterized protein n=1 Tax=Cystoisospora suis TaxID=483139 RepID=A0A2C6LF44_9APIC|nr:hypothetical protein CSUI_000787 [Cystoisospora suis]